MARQRLVAWQLAVNVECHGSVTRVDRRPSWVDGRVGLWKVAACDIKEGEDVTISAGAI